MSGALGLLLRDITTEEFLSEYYQQRALHIRGNQDHFKELFSWAQLNNVLNFLQNSSSDLKMSRNGRQFVPRNATELIQASRQGATLIVENIDRYDRKLALFLSELTDETAESNRLNMYLSQPEMQGYRAHYDTHDFFILQISGYKKWWVYPETTQSVLFNQKTHDSEPPPEEELYLHCTLEAGDVLYVPKGHWHSALATNEPSLHLTLAMFVRTGIDFIKWFENELTDQKIFRDSLPLFLGVKDGNVQEPNEFRNMRLALVEALNDASLYDRFLEYRIATARDRQPIKFPEQTTLSLDDCMNAVHFKRKPLKSAIKSETGRTELICGGQIFSFDGEIGNTLRFIISRDEFSKDELIAASDGLGWDQLVTILFPLMREGLLDGEHHSPPSIP